MVNKSVKICAICEPPKKLLWNYPFPASYQKTTVMNSKYSLQVVHPAFELLKKSAKILHFIAAAAILLNAWHDWQVHNESLLLSITQGILGIDILLLVFFTGNLLMESPKLNLIFRFIE